MHALFCGLALSSTPILALAAQVQPATTDTIATRYQLPGADCALFPVAARLPDWIPEKRLAQRCRFMPTAPQVTTTEKALATVQLLGVNPGTKTSQDSTYARNITRRLGQYQRQYFGFYNERKQPCVFINFLSEYPFTPEEAGLRPQPPGYVPYWQRRYIFIGDGGDDQWSIYYNLTTGSFYRYWHNLGLGGG
jgi:hypothetical protein